MTMQTQASTGMQPIDFYEAEGEVLHQEVYPAEIALPDGTMLTSVYAFVTSHRLLAYGETGDRQIGLIYGADLAVPGSVPKHVGTLRGSLQCDIAVGGTAWINLGRGCGCGSPLKAMRAPVPRVRR